MRRDLPLVLNQLANSHLAIHPRFAQKIAAVLSGRLNIEALVSEYGTFEREELEAIAGQARFDADAKRAEARSGSIVERVGDIAVIQIYGTLTRTWGVGPYSGSTGYDGILMQLEDAIRDDTIKGIWLDIDSGGGAVNGMFDCADMIFANRQRNGGKKPIWAMAADYAYSAAFLLGSSADRLHVGPAGGVGSVGVITMHLSFKRNLEADGIIPTVLREPPDKAKATEVEDLDAETEAHIREQLREIAGMFQAKVARNMGLSKTAVAAAGGLDYMGSHAKAVGFVSDVLPEPLAWEKFQRQITRR